jgi:ribosome-associated toxin RatA of RatAB toxin-antitoxin module
VAKINRSALVEFSAQQMFDLVNDIENYPKFMQGCVSAQVVSRSESELVGKLCLKRAGMRQEFTTRNTMDNPRSITMELVEGSFSNFHARWEFLELAEAACKVTLQMEFEFRSGLLDIALQKLFSSSANNLVDALVERAKLVYGHE